VQYAEEVIVVINLQPMKASNGVEEKTAGTSFIVMMADVFQKSTAGAKDRRNFKVYLKRKKSKRRC